MQDIFEKIKELAANQFGLEPGEITMETTFSDDLDADSIETVEFMMSIEEEYDIGEIDENVLAGIKTIGDIVNYIKEHV